MKPIHLASLLALAGCAGVPVPDNLKPGPNESLAQVVPAKGVQIYECRDGKWAFVAPDAELFDRSGKKIGTHYAGPHWEAADGSKVIGAVKARADAPQAGSIPWLLLGAKSVGPQGAFSGVTSIQRVRPWAAPRRPAPARNRERRRASPTRRTITSSPASEGVH